MQFGFLIQTWMWFFSLNPAFGYNSSPSANTPLTESNGVKDKMRLVSCKFSITAQSGFLINF